MISCLGRKLARRVGSGAQLVDAIGAAAGALPAPSALSTATLTCLAAVADTLNELPEQVSPLHGHRHSDGNTAHVCGSPETPLHVPPPVMCFAACAVPRQTGSSQATVLSRKPAACRIMQARALPGRAFPQALLQELLAVATGWQPPQRALAHQLFGAVTPAADEGLADPQTHSILSALWHEVRAHPRSWILTVTAS